MLYFAVAWRLHYNIIDLLICRFHHHPGQDHSSPRSVAARLRAVSWRRTNQAPVGGAAGGGAETRSEGKQGVELLVVVGCAWDSIWWQASPKFASMVHFITVNVEYLSSFVFNLWVSKTGLGSSDNLDCVLLWCLPSLPHLFSPPFAMIHVSLLCKPRFWISPIGAQRRQSHRTGG